VKRDFLDRPPFVPERNRFLRFVTRVGDAIFFTYELAGFWIGVAILALAACVFGGALVGLALKVSR
jgi:hypothetical protein